MNRALVWSLGLHIAVVVACLVLPRDWIVKRPRPSLTIELGGAPGPRTTGTTSIGGRTIEQVAPPPKRPEPIRPTPKDIITPAPVKAPPTAAKPVDVPRPEPPPPSRPPTTGQQITEGSTRVETGATGQGVGLTSGGGGTGGETNLQDFCCPEYLQLLTQNVALNWRKAQPEKGTTEIRFSILKDGRVANIEVAVPSGSSVLDRISRAAIFDLRMPPLPAAYPADKLTVRIKFPYEGH